MRCPLCSSKKEWKDLEAHIQEHIDDAQEKEMEYYDAGKEARAVFKKLFKREG